MLGDEAAVEVPRDNAGRFTKPAEEAITPEEKQELTPEEKAAVIDTARAVAAPITAVGINGAAVVAAEFASALIPVPAPAKVAIRLAVMAGGFIAGHYAGRGVRGVPLKKRLAIELNV